MEVEFDSRGLTRLVGKIKNFTRDIPGAMDRYTDQSTERLLELVVKHASGRPGPNVVTGQYISRFLIENKRVVNLSPQTHRLEYGFSGTDSLGRVYHQPPFPHFRPALEEMRLEYRRGIVPLIKKTWNAS